MANAGAKPPSRFRLPSLRLPKLQLTAANLLLFELGLLTAIAIAVWVLIGESWGALMSLAFLVVMVLSLYAALRNKPKPPEPEPKGLHPRTGRFVVGAFLLGCIVIAVVFQAMHGFRNPEPDLEDCNQILSTWEGESSTPCPTSWWEWKTIIDRHATPFSNPDGSMRDWATYITNELTSSWPDINVGAFRKAWGEYLQAKDEALARRLSVPNSAQSNLLLTAIIAGALISLGGKLLKGWGKLIAAVITGLILTSLGTAGWYLPQAGILPVLTSSQEEAAWNLFVAGATLAAFSWGAPKLGELVMMSLNAIPRPEKFLARLGVEIVFSLIGAIFGVIFWITTGIPTVVNTVAATPEMTMVVGVNAFYLGAVTALGVVTGIIDGLQAGFEPQEGQ